MTVVYMVVAERVRGIRQLISRRFVLRMYKETVKKMAMIPLPFIFLRMSFSPLQRVVSNPLFFSLLHLYVSTRKVREDGTHLTHTHTPT